MLWIAARIRARVGWDLETRTTASLPRDLARRAAYIEEAARHEKVILAIARERRTDLLARRGVGTIMAATVLCAWSHPGRIRSEAEFAKLSGTAPIPANSGKVTTHCRLNPYGDRRLNWTLHTVVNSRMHYDEETKAYVKRRTAEGLTARDLRRCLKRYVPREVFRLLENEPAAA